MAILTVYVNLFSAWTIPVSYVLLSLSGILAAISEQTTFATISFLNEQVFQAACTGGEAGSVIFGFFRVFSLVFKMKQTVSFMI